MTAKEFMKVVVRGPAKKLLKVRDEKRHWRIIEPDEQMPSRIYGFRIYADLIKARHGGKK